MFNWLTDYFTGYDSANADKAAAADSKLQAMNATDYAPGGKFYSPYAADSVAKNRASELATTGGYGQTNQRPQVAQAFTNGLKEGIGNVNSTIGDLVKNFFGLVPWYVWALALVGLFFWLGGAVFLRRQLTKGAA